jgi:hypothetical protein
VRAIGNAGAAVGARAGIELPDPDAVPLVVRTWIPKPSAPERHSPNCRARCCGSWQLSLPVPAPQGGGGQAPAPTAPQETPQETHARSRKAPRELPPAAEAVVPAPRSSGRRPGRARSRRRGLECAAGCGVALDPVWAAANGRDRHSWCLGTGSRPVAADSTGSTR